MESPEEAGPSIETNHAEAAESGPDAQAVVAQQAEAAPAETPVGSAELPDLTLAQSFWYCLANLGYGAFYSLNNAVLPLFLKAYTHDAKLIGLMGSTHSFEGTIIQPLVGSASDRLRTRWGRRRPFMLFFTPLSALFLLLTPAAAHLPGSVRLTAIVACIFLFTVTFNVAYDPYQALMPDITPEPQRGRVMGMWVLVGVIGQAALLMLKMPVQAKLILTALVMLLTTFLTCLLIREPKPPEAPAEVRRYGHEIREALRGLRTLRQAGRSLRALFFAGVGIGAVLPFLTLFVQKIAHANDEQAQQMFMWLMLATAGSVLPFGWLTDRFGPKCILFVGLALIALAALNGLWITTLPQVTFVMVLAGLGNAAQSASSYPLLTELVPAEEIGFYTGLQTTALSLASPLTVLITGELVNRGGYRNIFLVCAVSILVALVVLARVRLQDAKEEIAERNWEQGRAT